MKILLVNDYSTPTGGAELLLLGVRDELRKRGHQARLLASSARPLGADPAADYECFGTLSGFRTLLQTANVWAYQRMRSVLAEFQPDVVHVNVFLTQLSPFILPLLRNIPCVYHVAWYRPICPLGTKLLPDKTTCRVRAGAACYRNRCLPMRDWLPLMLQMKLLTAWRDVFDLIIANSEAVKDRLVADGFGVAEVVLNGIPRHPSRPPLTLPPTLAFSGRLVREKGVDVLLRAFATVRTAVPAARLLLAGDGPERQNLMKLIADLNISSNVSMLGHLGRAELERRLAPGWIQVVPSLWEEPFGLVAAEAMMRGTAVIASSSGGLKEVVRDGRTGILVPPGDVGALARAIMELLDNRERTEQMGKAGLSVALSSYTLEAHVEKLIEIYQGLCRKKESRTAVGGKQAARAETLT